MRLPFLIIGVMLLGTGCADDRYARLQYQKLECIASGNRWIDDSCDRKEDHYVNRGGARYFLGDKEFFNGQFKNETGETVWLSGQKISIKWEFDFCEK